MTLNLDKPCLFKCTLGTIRDIETVFHKGFFALVSELDKMTTSDQLRLLYQGAHRADANLSEEDFVNACEEHLGLGELTDALEQFVMELQYPGQSREEIERKIEKKLRRAESLKASASKTSFAQERPRA